MFCRLLAFLTIFIGAGFFHCATVPTKAQPANLAEFKNNKDKARSALNRFQIVEKDGEYLYDGQSYNFESIRPAIEQSSFTSQSTKDHLSSSQVWQTLGIVFGVAGGGMLGWNIGGELGTPEGQPTNVIDAFWIAGPVTIVGAVIFGFQAQSRFNDGVKSYNQDLKKALQLSSAVGFRPERYGSNLNEARTNWVADFKYSYNF